MAKWQLIKNWPVLRYTCQSQTLKVNDNTNAPMGAVFGLSILLNHHCFKLMCSSNMEATKWKRKAPFRKLPFCKVDKALLRLVHSENAIRWQPEIVSFEKHKNSTKLLFVSVSAFISFILPLKGKESWNLMISPEKTRVLVFRVLAFRVLNFRVLVFWVLGLSFLDVHFQCASLNS